MVGRMAASLNPYLIVFAASACGLIIEIVAGRVLAPQIGVSLYTWTSIIGVVLAGISIGNYVGGMIADRYPSSTTLGIILLAAGVSSLAILPLVDLLSDVFSGLPIASRIVLLTAALFLVPSLILGMVTPVVIKLRLKDIARTGNVVGRFYAVSTAGSILGTFITGFLLIQWIGTRPILLIVSFFLLAMALAFGNLWRAKVPGLALVAAFAGLAAFSTVGGFLDSGCLRESNYFCIKVRESTVDDRVVRVLTLDQLIHSYVALDDPTFLVYPYEQVMADVVTYVARQDSDLRALFIGGGGYTLPRFVRARYPESEIEVVEIDPEVTQVAFDYLGLEPGDGIATYNRDARMVVPLLDEGWYDLVVGDAFNDFSVPYHLTTLEFNEQILRLLSDRGVYMVNILDNLETGRFLGAFVNTLQRTFPYVYVMRDKDEWSQAPGAASTHVVVGARQPLSLSDLNASNLEAGRGVSVARIMPLPLFESWLNGRNDLLLTDDFAPVDNLIAPFYLNSR